MHLKETFGELLRRMREEAGLPIRKVAAHLDLDPSTLSKIERGDRSANKECIPILANLFKVEEKMLLIYYLSDRIFFDLLDEEYSEEVLKAAEEKIRYRRSKNVVQSQLDLK